MSSTTHQHAIPEIAWPLRRGGWRSAVDAAIDALYPRRCLVCDGAGQPGLDLCPLCEAELPWLPPACPRCALPSMFGLPCERCSGRSSPIQRTRAAFVYNAPIDRLLPRLKFHDDLCAGRLASSLMLRVLQNADRPDAVIAIPLHRKRLRKRGYNQALELAKPIAQALDLPLRGDLLHRREYTEAQSSLDKEARALNMQDVFVGLHGKREVPRHVTLVDDVMTTGATLEAAAIALKAVGVQRVDAWVCARVP
ncbi:ComF family protein [Solilutibacter silvestris]|uniref:Putative amidophosphoribosyltransferase n=1 Tax=Solilutibacter silvestris TaxID=1645665 RepID=A0A2K1Q0Y2_9GAMM|nr:ComF family protein [Lysobacter silvestris]PNS08706.1 putative amidophosphoribosyltransferase [Lysobacter silvestris]